ncbi:conserved hypothetical protein [Alteromonadaceae bacterium Bs31]|nr:conserved hypothetical protein [Alteromonadaceae bacterium Bs31]
MAKILYGVSGEGSGHSSRARLISSYLLEQGHSVKIVSYDRGYKNLKDDFDVMEIVGLTIVSEDNEVSKLKTITTNLSKIPSGTRALNDLRATIKKYQPDCVISDFEPCTAYLASHYELPLVTIDNQHRMRYMDYQVPSEMRKDQLITETVIRAMIPRPWVSLITSFHQGKLKNDRTFLFPPILRQQVLDKKPTQGEHILVYVTSGFDSLINLTAKFTRETFYVYGYDKEEVQGNIHYRPFSKDGFLDDLASCKAVVATAGFTLISEALYLGKPYLAFPMQGQFEQQLNAFMLQQQGYGVEGKEVSTETLAAFLYQLPDFSSKLANYPHNGNSDIQQKLDKLLSGTLEHLYQFKPK